MNDPILSIKNLTVKSKNKEKLLLNNISFSVNSGEVVALTGLNGSGKSTILKFIYRDNEKFDDSYLIEDGEIIYNNQDILGLNDKELDKYHESVVYIEQEDDFFKNLPLFFTVKNCIKAVLKYEELDWDEIQLKLNSFFPKRDKQKEIKLSSSPRHMSGGEKKMLFIFLRVLANPHAKLFIFDEPLNNLDSINATKISDLLTSLHMQNPDSAILVVTHCRIITCINRAIQIEDGKVTSINEKFLCHNCYGEPGEDNFYNSEIFI